MKMYKNCPRSEPANVVKCPLPRHLQYAILSGSVTSLSAIDKINNWMSKLERRMKRNLKFMLFQIGRYIRLCFSFRRRNAKRKRKDKKKKVEEKKHLAMRILFVRFMAWEDLMMLEYFARSLETYPLVMQYTFA